jgi:hypothetical protein
MVALKSKAVNLEFIEALRDDVRKQREAGQDAKDVEDEAGAEDAQNSLVELFDADTLHCAQQPPVDFEPCCAQQGQSISEQCIVSRLFWRLVRIKREFNDPRLLEPHQQHYADETKQMLEMPADQRNAVQSSKMGTMYAPSVAAAKEKEQKARNDTAASARGKVAALETALQQRQEALPPMQEGAEKVTAQQEVAELLVELQPAIMEAGAAEKHALEYNRTGRKTGTTNRTGLTGNGAAQPVLAAWLKAHLPNPKPSKEEEAVLCKEANIKPDELRGWFKAERHNKARKAKRAREKVQGAAAAAAAAAGKLEEPAPSSSALVQSHSGLVGLMNLGNTCFMNRCGYSAVATRRVERTHWPLFSLPRASTERARPRPCPPPTPAPAAPCSACRPCPPCAPSSRPVPTSTSSTATAIWATAGGSPMSSAR